MSNVSIEQLNELYKEALAQEAVLAVVKAPDDQQLIGFVEQSYRPYHPKHTFLSFYVNEASAYEPLIQQVKALEIPVRTGFVSIDQLELSRLLQAQGFELRRHTYEFETVLDDAQFGATDAEHPVLAKARLDRLADSLAPLYRQLGQYYRKTHAAVSPLTNLYSDEEFGSIMMQDADLTHSFVQQLATGERAYFITEANDEETQFVTYVGGDWPDVELVEFYRDCMKTLKADGVQGLLFEVDDTDAQASLLFHFFEKPVRSYDMYVYEPGMVPQTAPAGTEPVDSVVQETEQSVQSSETDTPTTQETDTPTTQEASGATEDATKETGTEEETRS